MRKFLTIVVINALLVALAACSAEQSNADAQSRPHVKTVRTAPVMRANASRNFALTGITRSAERAVMAFQVSGNLDKRPVDLGDMVETGDLIATLNNPAAEPQVAAAKARAAELKTRLAQAKRDEQRVKTLFDQSAATREEIEQTRAQRDALAASLNSAQAQLSQAQRTLGENRLTAPVAGEVEQIFFEPGEFIPAGQPVVSLSGSGVMEVEIGVPENLINDIKVGQPASLRLPLFDDREIKGRVTELASAAGGPGQLFQVILTLEEGQELRSGLTVEWAVQSSRSEQLLVPVSAVASPGGGAQARVYRIVDGKAKAVPVKLGAIVDERVVVEGELEDGESVIVVGLNNLADGRAVEVLQ